MKWILLIDITPGFEIPVLLSDGKEVWIDSLYKVSSEESKSGVTKSLSWSTTGGMVAATHWMPLPEPPKSNHSPAKATNNNSK